MGTPVVKAFGTVKDVNTKMEVGDSKVGLDEEIRCSWSTERLGALSGETHMGVASTHNRQHSQRPITILKAMLLCGIGLHPGLGVIRYHVRETGPVGLHFLTDKHFI